MGRLLVSQGFFVGRQSLTQTCARWGSRPTISDNHQARCAFSASDRSTTLRLCDAPYQSVASAAPNRQNPFCCSRALAGAGELATASRQKKACAGPTCQTLQFACLASVRALGLLAFIHPGLPLHRGDKLFFSSALWLQWSRATLLLLDSPVRGKKRGR